jgi:hypothetical protein
MRQYCRFPEQNRRYFLEMDLCLVYYPRHQLRLNLYPNHHRYHQSRLAIENLRPNRRL